MTTTSQTYSLIPTGTVASSSPSATNGSNNGGNSFYDLFSSAGSPPLIMTFLSIGLFIVAMTGVFGWRRLSRSRSRGQGPQLVVGLNKPISLFKRPMLWDVWTDLQIQETSATKTIGWGNITPMTAILTFLVPPIQPPPLTPITSVGLSSRMAFGMVRCLASGVKRFYPPPEPGKNEVIPLTSRTSDAIEWGDASSLQVSVIIDMPTRRHCKSGTSEKDVDAERVELGEFYIGTMDVPWSQGGG